MTFSEFGPRVFLYSIDKNSIVMHIHFGVTQKTYKIEVFDKILKPFEKFL